MTQLSNVPMQPKPTDATEHLTLIEKLEQEKECWHDDGENNVHRVIDDCIDIVKQRQAESGWIACSERMPEDEQEVLWWNEAYQCLVIGEWRENRELVFYRNGDYADVSEFFYWQCLPKPPSEVRDD